MNESEPSSPPSRPERSPRKYPYYTLNYAVDLATKLYAEGGGTAAKKQLSELLGISPNASSLEMRIISAVMFGLVIRQDGIITITSLGRQIAAPISEEEKAGALSAAFDSVELFSAVRKRFAGSPLPSEAGLKVAIARDFGVAESQKNEACKSLVRSAKDSGILITRGSNQYLTVLAPQHTRLSSDERGMPEATPEIDSKSTRVSSVDSQVDTLLVGTGLHASLSGLVNELASNGDDWSAEDRAVWEAALRAVLDFVYPNTRKKVGGGESRMGQEP